MAELINKDVLYGSVVKEINWLKDTKESTEKAYQGGFDLRIAEANFIKGFIENLPTTTEAEIRAMAEHTYENCHNITCRRKCQKDGYNMAIDEFAEKLKADYIKYDIDMILENNNLMYYSASIVAFKQYIDAIAEQLKGE